MRKNGKDFEPIVRISMTEVVEERIRKYLKKQEITSWGPDPGETELSARLNVSRNVIREALSRFRIFLNVLVILK